jgi:hypothetical protein
MASIEDALLDALAAAPAGKSLSPDEVAKALDPVGWRRRLPQVKAAAVGLGRAGKLVILRHNKPVDPFQPIKGVYRLRSPSAPT